MSDEKNSAADAWSAQADLYANQAMRITELHAMDLVAVLTPHIIKSKTILEIGCGTGAFGRAYLQQFPKGVPGQKLILTDVASGMLEKAQASIQPPNDYATSISFQVQDGTQLKDIADDSIDLVVSSFGVFLIPDQEAALSEIRRILKPDNGIFGNASWCFQMPESLKSYGLGPSMHETFTKPLIMIDPNAAQAQMKGVQCWSTEEAIQKHISDDGRLNVISTTKAIHTTSIDWKFFWNSMEQNPVSKVVYEKATDEQKEAVRQEVRAFLASYGQPKPQTEPMILTTVSLLALMRASS
jgi:ubiquinone/menaquinone biosynthesis C-methylase UbiE